jgi:hypothetical protein
MHETKTATIADADKEAEIKVRWLPFEMAVSLIMLASASIPLRLSEHWPD